MSMFKSWQKYAFVEEFDNSGASLGLKRTEVARWSTEHTINWLRRSGRELVQNACRDGWHINLIDFVQHQHRLPNGEECEALVMDFHKIEEATPTSHRRPEILKKREEVKAELLKPIELKAAG